MLDDQLVTSKQEMKRRKLLEKAYKLLGVNSEATMDLIFKVYQDFKVLTINKNIIK